MENLEDSIENVCNIIISSSRRMMQSGDHLGATLLINDGMTLRVLLKKNLESNQLDKQVDDREEKNDDLANGIRNLVNNNPEKHLLADVVGLKEAKSVIMMSLGMPILFPKSFMGKNSLINHFLLYGLPGSGKTFFVKAVAYEANKNYGYKLISVNASSLLSKWQSESEKLTNILFDISAECSPCIIFIDEIDQLLSTRQKDSGECSTRIKAQFLSKMWSNLGNVIVIGTTNVPQNIDAAIISRFSETFYVPLPNEKERLEILKLELESKTFSLSSKDFQSLSTKLDGYSGRDIAKLLQNAWIHQHYTNAGTPNAETKVNITKKNLEESMSIVKSSVKEKDKNDMDNFLEENNVLADGTETSKNRRMVCSCWPSEF